MVRRRALLLTLSLTGCNCGNNNLTKLPNDGGSVSDAGGSIDAGSATDAGQLGPCVPIAGSPLRLDSSFQGTGIATIDFGGDNVEATTLWLDAAGNIDWVGTQLVNYKPHFALARLFPNGALDPSFGDGGSLVDPAQAQYATGAAPQSDGKWLVAAGYTNNTTYLVRYLPGGALDPTFGAGGSVPLSGFYTDGLLPDPAGLLAVGEEFNGPSTDGPLLTWLDASGQVDTSRGQSGTEFVAFGPNGGTTNATLRQPDGNVVVACESAPGGSDDFEMMRFFADGGLDPAFGAAGISLVQMAYDGGSDQPLAMAVQPDGKLVVGGSLWKPDPTGMDFLLTRLLTDGSVDPTFGNQGWVVLDFGATDALTGLVLMPDGKVLAVGTSQPDNLMGPSAWVFARFTPAGALDPTFGNGGTAALTWDGGAGVPALTGSSAILTPSGEILAAGTVFVPSADGGQRGLGAVVKMCP